MAVSGWCVQIKNKTRFRQNVADSVDTALPAEHSSVLSLVRLFSINLVSWRSSLNGVTANELD